MIIIGCIHYLSINQFMNDIYIYIYINECCLIILYIGFECDVLLARAVANKLPNWSLLGRLRKTKPPKSINEKDVAAGRILCDTYKAAKEFLRETTYNLTYLANSQLKSPRTEVDPMDVPKYFSSSQDLLNLANVNMNDALLVQRLMLKLQVIPLTRQLTNLSGKLIYIYIYNMYI